MRAHAVVLGASIAGLLGARALSDAYETVTLVERDELPHGPAHRRGVPQGRHAHALLARGGQVMDALFPGLSAELVAAGAPTGDLSADARWILSGHRLKQAGTGQRILFASRPMLESHVRERVRALPNVVFADRLDVVAPVTSADRRTVVGVSVRESGGQVRTLPADLVLDATGRGSRTPRWLSDLGYDRPPVDEVQMKIGYASRSYRLRAGALGTDQLILQSWTPEYPRAATVVAQEDGRHLVTLVGMLGDAPPTDADAFLEFVAGLPLDDIHRAIRDGEPLEDPVAFRYPASVRHRYERLRRFPDGLLLIGDAICSFNPFYGQGMTVAGLEAVALGRLVAQPKRPSWRQYFKTIAGIVDVPWDIATGGDLAFPAVDGDRTPKVRLINAYLPRFHAAAERDPGLATAFLRVAGLLDWPEALLRPDRVARVLTQPRRRPSQVH
ncbi:MULTISPECIES: FAD-dependent oxidoreductase [Pseudofrankia]|uniref:FAD-dependent oxidoreductase n=1 Tax=Pseudofrankia TaxID=2994363 RepID=UPI000560A5B5|nr:MULTISPECIES: FAD-binding monooxygenase [Pseudofrankia]OHV41056.1 FAD-binding monooxygenase [Pseudofrankia sp. EUN1h]